MITLTFGKNAQISFIDEHQFFEAIGFLSKNDGLTSLHWEKNEEQGAWGSEGRIHCYKNIDKFPEYFASAFTAGTGNIKHRINCNEYIECLTESYGFVFGIEQDVDSIVAKVPDEYIDDFERGLAI